MRVELSPADDRLRGCLYFETVLVNNDLPQRLTLHAVASAVRSKIVSADNENDPDTSEYEGASYAAHDFTVSPANGVG